MTDTPSSPEILESSPTAATLWQDHPALFELLRRRIASCAPNTQGALAADWCAWRA